MIFGNSKINFIIESRVIGPKQHAVERLRLRYYPAYHTVWGFCIKAIKPTLQFAYARLMAS